MKPTIRSVARDLQTPFAYMVQQHLLVIADRMAKLRDEALRLGYDPAHVDHAVKVRQLTTGMDTDQAIDAVAALIAAGKPITRQD